LTIQAEELYHETVSLLKNLDEEQLQTVHSMVMELSAVHKKWKSPLGIETEEQLWEHIDHSIAQAKAGEGCDAVEMADRLKRELAL
jgi:hypothetical protein